MKLSEWYMNMKGNLETALKRAGGAGAAFQEKMRAASNAVAAVGIDTQKYTTKLMDLKATLDLMKQDREFIDSGDISKMRQANVEINKLEKNIRQLESMNGGVVKGWIKDAFSQIPGAGLISNPLVLAAGAFMAVTTPALQFETAMAKVNATAQMTEVGVNSLQNKLLDLGANSSADVARLPDAFEKINSQVNNVPLSLDILKSSLKGAEAGFADIDVVSGALARTLSIVGAENTNAAEVLDTLMAAKRLGAGEFQDFANYVPGLVAAGKNLGVGFKDAAGLFAYMTAKGQDASNATMLLQNVFTAFSKGEIRDGLKAQGVAMYDNTGKLRSMGLVMQDVAAKLEGMSDLDKTKWMEKVGLRDAQAKQGFATLLSDVGLLNDIMGKTANPVGETEKALTKTATTAKELHEAWNKIAASGIKLGGVILPVINLGLWFFGAIVGWISNHTKAFGLGVMGAVGALGYFKIAAWLSAGGLEAMALGGWSAATGVFALSTALKSIGIGVIIMAVALLLEFIIEVVQNCGELRAIFLATFDFIKGLAKGFMEMMKGIISGLTNVWDGLKDGNLSKVKAGFADAAASIGKNVGGAWTEAGKGYDKYLADFEKKKAKQDKMMEGMAGMPTMPKMAGMPEMAGMPTELTTDGETNSKVSNGLSEVSGGGKEVKSISVQIQSLIGEFTNTSSTLGMSEMAVRALVEEMILRAVNGAELAIGRK